MSSAVQGENLDTKAQLCDKTLKVGTHGISDFKLLMECQNETYADKTLFIKDAILNRIGVILFTRPRRFGKSLILSTLNYYINFKLNDSEHLFSGLNIATPEFTAFKKVHMHKYAVILLNFGSIKQTTFSEAWGAITGAIATAFAKHEYLLHGNTLSEFQKEMFRDYLYRKSNDRSFWARSIQFLCDCLNLHFGHDISTFIIVDEYDAPLHTSHVNKYYVPMVNFFQHFYFLTLKENNNFRKAVLTGVTRIGKESLFSDLNNILTFTTFENRFSDICGFTPEEVDLLIKRANKGEAAKKMLETRYNGYLFGNTTIFNPWSVILDLFEGIPFAWPTTGSTNQLEKLLKSYGLYPILTLQRLLANETVTKMVDDNLVYRDMGENEHSYWTYLVHLGYFSCAKPSFERSDSPIANSWNVELRIPNQEVRREIEKALYFNHGVKLGLKIPSYSDLVDNLVKGNFTAVKDAMESYVKNAGTYFRKSGESYESEKLTEYVTQMLNGVALRYDTPITIKKALGKVSIEIIPKTHKGNPVYVTLQEVPTFYTTKAPSKWQKIKTSLCSFLKSVDRNKTEIIIQYTKNVLEICVAIKTLGG